MRRFELFLVYGELFAIGWPATFGIRTRRGIAAGALLLLFVLHWRVEGLRWQMLPLYLAALGLAAGDLLALERSLTWPRRIARGAFGSAGLALAALLPLALPVPTLPSPTGPLEVGTVTVQVIDADRVEMYGPNPGGPRRLNVQVWYPSVTDGSGQTHPWSDDWDVVAPAMARNLGFPGWFFSHTGYVEAHSHPSATEAAGSFPIVIYSHGWTGFRTIAVNQAENLASNGYIVIAPDHTYGAIATVFPDGEVVELDANALPEETAVTDTVYAGASQLLVATFADDIVSILDALDLGAAGPFRTIINSADTTRIGLYGHSTGGGAALRVCLVDERCDAVLGLDAWVEPIPDQILAIDPSRPSLFMRSDEWRDNDNDAILRGLAERSTAVSYWIGVDGAGHNDFVLTPLLSPVADRLGLKGPIPAGRIVPIVDRYLVGFFDVFLLGTGSAAIDSPGAQEVSLEIINPG